MLPHDDDILFRGSCCNNHRGQSKELLARKRLKPRWERPLGIRKIAQKPAGNPKGSDALKSGACADTKPGGKKPKRPSKNDRRWDALRQGPFEPKVSRALEHWAPEKSGDSAPWIKIRLMDDSEGISRTMGKKPEISGRKSQKEIQDVRNQGSGFNFRKDMDSNSVKSRKDFDRNMLESLSFKAPRALNARAWKRLKLPLTGWKNSVRITRIKSEKISPWAFFEKNGKKPLGR